MAKIAAKGKKRQQMLQDDAEAFKEYEERSVIPVVKREKQEKQSVSSLEIKAVVKNTFERLFKEFDPRMGEKEIEAYSDDRATQMLRIIKHGIPEPGHGTKIIEEEQKIPLCQNCR